MDKMKILIIAKKVDGSYIEAGNILIKALEDNNALFLDYIELYNRYGHKGVHNYIENYIVQYEINTVIYGSTSSEFYFDISFFERLRRRCFLVMHTTDLEHYYEVRDQYYAQAMDLVLLQDIITTFKLQQIGIQSLPFYGHFDTVRHRKIKNLVKDIDVSFVGRLSTRVGGEEYVTHLLDNNVNIKLFGIGSQEGVVTTDKKIEIFNKTRINLNFSGMGMEKKDRFSRKSKTRWRMKQIKGRPIEVAICGGFVLSEYVPGLEHYFELGKEIDVFYDKEDLLEKIKYYLKHDEERESIARRGYERARRDYDVKLAVPKLLSTIDELREKKIYKPSVICLDEEFIRNYTTFRIFLIMRFIVKEGKWKFAIEELKIVLNYRKLDWYQIYIFITKGITDNFSKIRSYLKKIA